MNNNNFRIRELRSNDLETVCQIYNHAVRTGTATLDTEEKSLAEMQDWLERHNERYPAVGVEDEHGLIGYGSLSPFAARGGYKVSAELSIYLMPDACGKGIGKAIAHQLIEHAKNHSFTTILALVTATNHQSLRLLDSLDFVENGIIERIGFKQGQMVDLIVRQLHLAYDPTGPATNYSK